MSKPAAANVDPTASAPNERKRKAIRRNLLAWFDRHARVLPWRTSSRDPYAVWVSEIMLQQTRVSTVVPYFERFLEKFPNVPTLAEAELDDVLAAWSGLGYYRRARALHAAARQLHERGEATLPGDFDALLKLSGIGQYTAAAIASMAFGQPVAVVDGNVLRVLARITADDGPIEATSTQKRIRAVADSLVGPDRPGSLNEAMMELGATVCTPTSPTCLTCPIRKLCGAHRDGVVDLLPVTTKKKASPRVRLVAFVVAHEDRVLMCRRREDGLFGGLWEPPMVQAPSSSYERKLASQVGGKAVRVRGKVEHVLTHRVLEVVVMRWGVDRSSPEVVIPEGYERAAWFGPSERASLGVSTLANKVLERGGVERGGAEKRRAT
jgi:A/G-specific adenine glycosylase